MRLCVILPGKDEALVIARAIHSVVSAGVPGPDIYVIDDGSRDGTSDIARSFAGVNVLRNEINRGKSASIARVMTEFDLAGRYDIITLMDADTVVNVDYYKEVKKGFTQPDVAVVCGRAMSVPYNWLTAYRCLGYFWTHYVYRGAQSDMGVINVAPGCASSYRADVFLQLEWNNDTLVEDMDVTIQVHRKKLGKLIYCPQAKVYTQDPRTLRDYTKQMNRWYTGTWQIAIKYKMWRSWSKIDLEFKLLMGEGLLFSVFMLSIPLLALLYPMRSVLILTVDSALTIFIAICCGIADGRKDVILASPLYSLMKFVDCGVLLVSFWQTIVRRRQAHYWFSVRRY